MATIKEVAKKSGVSVGTVSAVLRGESWVTEDTRRKVLRVVRELNYRPNPLARSLRTQKTGVIGLVVTDITNPFFSLIVRAVENYLRKYNFNIILCDTNEDYAIGTDVVRVLIDRMVEGIILVGDVLPEEELEEVINTTHVPIVAVERDYGNIYELSMVLVDSVKGGYIATRHLLNLGYRDIAIVTGPIESERNYSSIGRLEGYKEALREEGIELKPEFIVKSDFTFNGGYTSVKAFLERGYKPRAIFASNDLMAIGAMVAIKEEGFRIPDEIAVVGYDDTPEASFTEPPLTTVHLSMEELGTQAARFVVESIKDRDFVPRKYILPVDIVIRESCGAFKIKGK